MPKYFYTAKSIKGETQSGVLKAENPRQLSKKLRQKGLVLIKTSLDEKAKRRPFAEIFQNALPFFGKVSLVEKLMFTRNLQIMISAGVFLPRALATLASQTKNKKFHDALKNIEGEIIRGRTFHESLAKYPDIFSELFVNMIKVGEEAGTLEEVLKVLTRQLERDHELKSKVTGALIYPTVIILAMIGIGILMLAMVIPQLAETFEELNVDLPPTTQFVIFLGKFLAEKWYLAFLIFLVFIFLIRSIAKTKSGKRAIDKLILKIPIISPIIRKVNSAYTVRTLSSLIISGTPIVRSLEIIAGVLGNVYFKEAIATAAERVRKGSKLSDALKPYDKLYPLLVIQMVEIGEETGETSTILTKLADFFEEEVTNTTKNLSAVIEPILMLFIGGVVGFFAISMIQPIYSMLGAIK